MLWGWAGVPQPTATVNASSDPTGYWNVNVMIAGDVPRVAPSEGLEPASELSLDCACAVIGSAATMATATPISAKALRKSPRESAER